MVVPKIFSFGSWDTDHPADRHPGERIDAQFDAHANAIRTLEARIDAIVRADGKLHADVIPFSPSRQVAAPRSGFSHAGSTNVATLTDAAAENWAEVSMEWAEHMPDTIPGNILATNAITGDHWSSRWWANRAALSAAHGTTAVQKLKHFPFDGFTTIFPLLDELASGPIVPVLSVSQLSIVVDGVSQEPGIDFVLAAAGASVQFTTAPAADAKNFATYFLQGVTDSGGLVVGGTASLSTRVVAAASAIGADIAAIETSGYAVAGDGGGAVYYRVGASTPGGFRSTDGAWWALDKGLHGVRQYGAVGDGVADDTAAVNLAFSAGYAFNVPAGSYKTSYADFNWPAGRLWGQGSILTNSPPNKWAPYYSSITARPATTVVANSVATGFGGDISKVQFAMQHTISGAATLGQPATGYMYTDETAARLAWMSNTSGWNQQLNTNDGRTSALFERVHLTQTGQGDMMAYMVSGAVGSTLPGSTHWLANPAVSAFVADMYAGVDGAFLNPVEIDTRDGGFDASAVSFVGNMIRNNNTGAKTAYWACLRGQSVGSAPVDDFAAASGKYDRGLNFAYATFTGANQAAIVLKATQRIYGNALGGSDPFRLSSLGTDYLYSSGGAWQFIANATNVLTLAGLAGAVNGYQINSQTAGTPPQLVATGADTDIDVSLNPKGAGAVRSPSAFRAMRNTAVPAGGTAGAGYMFSNVTNFGVFFGSGLPTLSAAKGSLYLRSDGTTAAERLYVNTNGTTGWTNLTAAA